MKTPQPVLPYRTCYYRCGYKWDVEELLASENKCFLNRGLVYEQYFWFFFFLDSGLCFLISSHHLLKINSLFLSQMMLLLWKSQFSSLNLHFEWKKKVFLLSQEWWLFFSRMTTWKQCISRSLVDTIWWYLLLITKLTTTDISWKYH